jgi:hypothetical protein
MVLFQVIEERLVIAFLHKTVRLQKASKCGIKRSIFARDFRVPIYGKTLVLITFRRPVYMKTGAK